MSAKQTTSLPATKNFIPGINLFRFILTVFVILHHAELFLCGWDPANLYPLRCLYLSVEGFFILSGFLLARSAEQHISPSAAPEVTYGAYIWHRVKRFYPTFFFCLVVIAFIIWARASFDFDSLLIVFGTGLLVSKCIWFSGEMTGTWFIPVWFWGGNLLLAALFFRRKIAYNLLLPGIILFGYGWVWHTYGTFSDVISQGSVFLSAGFLRGTAGMALGMCLYRLLAVPAVSEFLKHLRGWWLLELACWMGIVRLCLFRMPSEADFNIVVCWVVLLTLIATGRSVLCRWETGSLRRMWDVVLPSVWHIFLMHGLIAGVAVHYSWPFENKYCIYLTAVALCVAGGIVMRLAQPYFYRAGKRIFKKWFWVS